MPFRSERSPLLTSPGWHSPYDFEHEVNHALLSSCHSDNQADGVINTVAQQHTDDRNHRDYGSRAGTTNTAQVASRLPEKGSSAAAGSRCNATGTGVYARRWYLLLLLSLSVTLQNAVWGTWGPIAESAQAVFGWDTTMLFLIINCGNLGVLLPVLFTGYLISRKGLRVSMVTCSVLLALGSGLRTIQSGRTVSTVMIGLGQFCNGLAGSVTQVIPPSLSETWFPSNERATATAISVVANALGGLVGFTLGPNIVSEISNSSDATHLSQNDSELREKEVEHISHQIWIYTMLEFGVGAILLLLTLVTFPDKPPRPPSQSAIESRTNFTSGLMSVLQQPLIIAIAVSCAIPWAVFGNWMGLLNVNLHDIGISQHQAGLFGLYGSIGGIVGGTVIGRFADKVPRRLKRFVVGLFVITLACILWITCMRNGYIPRSTVQFAIAITLMCGVMNGTLPLCYEMACEVGYPVHEGIIGIFISLAINLAAVVFLLVKLVPDIGVNWMNWTFVGVLSVSICCLVVLRERYNRTDVDDAIDVKAGKIVPHVEKPLTDSVIKPIPISR